MNEKQENSDNQNIVKVKKRVTIHPDSFLIKDKNQISTNSFIYPKQSHQQSYSSNSKQQPSILKNKIYRRQESSNVSLEELYEWQHIIRHRFLNKFPVEKNSIMELQNQNDQKDIKRETSTKWKKIKNFLHGIYLFKNLEISQIQNANQLEENLQDQGKTFVHLQEVNPQSDEITNNDANDKQINETNQESTSQYNIRVNQEDINNAFASTNNWFLFLESITRGSKQDLEKIQNLIDNDAINYLHSVDDPERLVNKVDKNGQSPLYIACKNGNLEVVKILIENKAYPYNKFILAGTHKNEESILQVSARWGFADIVKYLLENVRWDKISVEKSLAYSNNKDITKYLQIYLNIHNMEDPQYKKFFQNLFTTLCNCSCKNKNKFKSIKYD